MQTHEDTRRHTQTHEDRCRRAHTSGDNASKPKHKQTHGDEGRHTQTRNNIHRQTTTSSDARRQPMTGTDARRHMQTRASKQRHTQTHDDRCGRAQANGDNADEHRHTQTVGDYGLHSAERQTQTISILLLSRTPCPRPTPQFPILLVCPIVQGLTWKFSCCPKACPRGRPIDNGAFASGSPRAPSCGACVPLGWSGLPLARVAPLTIGRSLAQCPIRRNHTKLPRQAPLGSACP
eukprot:980711-Pyramimonas_sp.AAC.1